MWREPEHPPGPRPLRSDGSGSVMTGRHGIVGGAALHSGTGFLVLIAALLALSAWLVAGMVGLAAALVAVAISLTLAPRLPPDLVARWHGGIPAERVGLDELVGMARQISLRAGLPAMPRIYVKPEGAVGAFTVGDARHAAIIVSAPLLRMLTPREIKAVLSHEIAHIVGRDTALMMVANILGQVTAAVAFSGLLVSLLAAVMTGRPALSMAESLGLALAPTAASLLQLALSRRREFAADLIGARLTGDPGGLISALARIDAIERRQWRDWLGSARRLVIPSLLRSHPPTGRRIRRLFAYFDGLEARGAAVPPPWLESRARIRNRSSP